MLILHVKNTTYFNLSLHNIIIGFEFVHCVLCSNRYTIDQHTMQYYIDY